MGVSHPLNRAALGLTSMLSVSALRLSPQTRTKESSAADSSWAGDREDKAWGGISGSAGLDWRPFPQKVTQESAKAAWGGGF